MILVCKSFKYEFMFEPILRPVMLTILEHLMRALVWVLCFQLDCMHRLSLGSCNVYILLNRVIMYVILSGITGCIVGLLRVPTTLSRSES